MYFTGWNSQDRNVGKEQVNSINGASFTAVFEPYSVNFDPILVF